MTNPNPASSAPKKDGHGELSVASRFNNWYYWKQLISRHGGSRHTATGAVSSETSGCTRNTTLVLPVISTSLDPHAGEMKLEKIKIRNECNFVLYCGIWNGTFARLVSLLIWKLCYFCILPDPVRSSQWRCIGARVPSVSHETPQQGKLAFDGRKRSLASFIQHVGQMNNAIANILQHNLTIQTRQCPTQSTFSCAMRPNASPAGALDRCGRIEFVAIGSAGPELCSLPSGRTASGLLVSGTTASTHLCTETSRSPC